MRTRRFSSSPAARPSRQKLTNEASSPPQLLAMSHIFCWTQGALKTTEGKAEVPSLDKEGWLRPLRKCREAPLEAQTGWLVQATDYRKLNEPPRPRLQRNGTIYLMARRPLLCQGVSRAVLLASSITERKSAARKQKTYRPTSLRGDFAFPAGCPRRPCPAEDLWVMIRACARGFVLGPLRGWNSIGRNHRNVQIAHICYTKLMRHDFALENGGLLRLHDPVKREHHNG